jgi:hypothetical protein
MLSQQETEQTYWGVDYTAPVDYTPVWVDDRFGAYLNRVCGGQNQFLKNIARVVSLTATEFTSRSHPTGGRVFVYDLPEPFIDPDFNLPCLEIDVKGVMLTKSGFDRYQKGLISTGNGRQEMMLHRDRGEVFGPFASETAIADKDNLHVVRSHRIITPYPVGILRLKSLVFNDDAVSVEYIKQLFQIPVNREFALYIRAWPVTSTRVSDLFGVMSFEHVDMIRNGQPKKEEVIQLIRQARQRWTEIELPRMEHALQAPVLAKKLYEDLLRCTVHSVRTMIINEMSPVTGEESDENSMSHAHLQNWTTFGALVEWSPVTDYKTLDSGSRRRVLMKLLDYSHQFIGAMGLAMLEDYRIIPSMFKFLKMVNCDIPEVKEITNLYDPNNSSFTVLGQIDPIIEFAKANQEVLV